jgi:hypothetical protein
MHRGLLAAAVLGHTVFEGKVGTNRSGGARNGGTSDGDEQRQLFKFKCNRNCNREISTEYERNERGWGRPTAVSRQPWRGRGHRAPLAACSRGRALNGSARREQGAQL